MAPLELLKCAACFFAVLDYHLDSKGRIKRTFKCKVEVTSGLKKITVPRIVELFLKKEEVLEFHMLFLFLFIFLLLLC